MKYLFPIVTIVGSSIGAILLIVSLMMDSFPAQGAFAATAVGFAVIPYCITRAIELLTEEREDLLRSIVSEIRRGRTENQSLASHPPRSAGIHRTIANPRIGKSRPETITHPERGVTGRRNNPDRRIFERI